MFIIHRPWKTKPEFDMTDWHTTFKHYIKSKNCPDSIKAQCRRAELNYFMKTSADDVTTDEPPIDEDDTPSEVVDFLHLMQSHEYDETNDMINFDFGLKHDWSQVKYVSIRK